MPPALRDTILAYTDRHPGGPNGVYPTEIPAVALIRIDAATPLRHVLYDSALIVVVQGAKDVMLGGDRYSYRAGQFMALSVGLPVLARITAASPETPYLALALALDVRLLGDLIREIGPVLEPPPVTERGLLIGDLTPALLDGVERIAALLETPDALRILYRSIAREVFYWLLTGPEGTEFRRLATPESHAHRIAEAIGVMRAQLTKKLSVERMAAIANMSPSSFHQHFKAVTSMSPRQYQKQLRLLEARRMMLADGADASRAAYQVGYESPSQFSREYSRLFGAPPHRDVTELRATVA